MVGLRYAHLDEILGMRIPREEVHRILVGLGFQLDVKSDDQALFSVPPFRTDVTREEDLVEEVARVFGYEKIPVRLPRGVTALAAERPEVLAEYRAKEVLAGAGFHEVVNYSFVSPRELKLLHERTAPLRIANPLSAEQSVMRTTLLAGLLQNVSRAVRHQIQTVRLYELGRAYLPDPEGGVDHRPAAREPLRLAGVLWGRRDGRVWSAQDVEVDFFDAKGAIQAVLAALRVPGIQFVPLEDPVFHPRASAAVLLDEARLGRVGELHPVLVRELGLPRGIFAFELEAEPLFAAAIPWPDYQALPRYPAVLRDLAVLVSAGIPHEDVAEAIREAGGEWVEQVSLFDQYTGSPVPEGQKNLAFALQYRAPDRTLTDTEVAEVHERIVQAVNARFGASLRAS
jgi:phenylalanyl-tRNA synthetase beta chain